MPSELVPLSWQYIAGFFDGDGRVDIEHRSQACSVVKIFWYQSEPHHEILQQIFNFLKWNDPWVDASWKPPVHRIQTHRKAKSVEHSLFVSNKDGCKTCLESMMPYLIRRAPEARRALTLLGSENSYKPIAVDWEYLAGFTDAEGHIEKSISQGYAAWRLGWTQSLDHSYVLDEIKDYLIDRGFSVGEATIKNPEFPDSRCRQINITSKSQAKLALQRMYGWLVVKKQLAKQMIDHETEVERLRDMYGWNYLKNSKKIRGEVLA